LARRATDAPKSSRGPSVTVLTLGGAVIVLAALVGWMLLRSRQPAPAPSTPVTTDAAATPSPTPTAAPVVSPTPDPNASTPPVTLSSTPSSSTSPAATTSSTSGATVPLAPGASPNRSGAPGATPTPGATPGAPRGAPPGALPNPTPGPTGASAPATTAADPAVTFSDVKYFHITGNKGDDEDATLRFGNGQIEILPKKTGLPLATQLYRRVAHATYVRAKNPKWDSGLPGPDAALDLSNLFRNARHWLVLQSRSDFVVLRLDDSNWQSILDMFEARTGLKIDRPPANDK
jgi:hypothetical protein